MAFRWGNKGRELWPYCFEQGIAAIGYYDGDNISIVDDCSKISEDEYNHIWRTKGVNAPAAQGSLKKLAYRMEKGDIIYAKEGVNIVGKGTIKTQYKYKPNVLDVDGILWEHYVEVDWEKDFQQFKLDLEANQHTVLELNTERVNKLREMETQTIKTQEKIEAEEGEQYKSEATFRRRNTALIEAKKYISDYSCEVCGMNFEEVYGDIGRKYIIAHHKNPIGNRDVASKTTMDDIALVCSNCHAMLHRTNPPLSVEELRTRLNQ